ncbi:endospore germination permease [Bacillus sp. CGMCC 1.16607]|uniref:GerAB/ArcD/ProY family transporter n=1 Tax=Bacillus sp. CGMCC 1.16607 TaxID=3351842 RepID=UPI0036310DD6
MEKLSLWQFFLLIFIFETGSAIVVGIAGEAKQDAWIAILLATFIGVFLILFYFMIVKKGDYRNLFEIMEYCFGKYVGKAIIFIYITYFFYLSARVLRDFGELMVSTIFEKTPVEFLSLTIMLLIAYILFLGIEVLGRMSEIFIPYIVMFLLFVGLGILLSGEIELSNLQPVLGDGVMPILKTIFPSLIGFPFGELIVFTFIIPIVSNLKKAKLVAMISVFLSGILLVYTVVIQIGTLGVNIRNRSNFPMLSAAREISLLNFIERIDLLIVFIVMFGIIVKISIFFYGGLIGLEKLFHLPYRKFVVPMSLMIAYFSIVISTNFAEHIEEGLKVVPHYLHLPLQMGVPLLILPILFMKKIRSSR